MNTCASYFLVALSFSNRRAWAAQVSSQRHRQNDFTTPTGAFSVASSHTSRRLQPRRQHIRSRCPRPPPPAKSCTKRTDDKSGSTRVCTGSSASYDRSLPHTQRRSMATAHSISGRGALRPTPELTTVWRSRRPLPAAKRQHHLRLHRRQPGPASDLFGR